MRENILKPGDWVIYRKQKVSTIPGPRAQNTVPSPNGETYSYVVEKYWIVEEVLTGQVRLVTRRGKRHVVALEDGRLRSAKWWERWLLASRFRAVETTHNDDVRTAQENSPR